MQRWAPSWAAVSSRQRHRVAPVAQLQLSRHDVVVARTPCEVSTVGGRCELTLRGEGEGMQGWGAAVVKCNLLRYAALFLTDPMMMQYPLLFCPFISFVCFKGNTYRGDTAKYRTVATRLLLLFHTQTLCVAEIIFHSSSAPFLSFLLCFNRRVFSTQLLVCFRCSALLMLKVLEASSAPPWRGTMDPLSHHNGEVARSLRAVFTAQRTLGRVPTVRCTWRTTWAAGKSTSGSSRRASQDHFTISLTRV